MPAATLAVLPSPLAPHATFLFLGSRVADSLLLQLGSGAASGAATGGAARADEGGGRPPKRARIGGGGGGGGGGGDDDDDDDADEEERALFGAAAARAQRTAGARRLPLVLRDSLVSAAPTAEMAISPDLSLVPPEVEVGRAEAAALPRELLLCGGRGRSGSLSRTSQGVRLACLLG